MTNREKRAGSNNPNGKVCGIVMPIAAMNDTYSEDHWRKVKMILQRAIEAAGFTSQLVWENPQIDVIQSAILQNLYENDVVICDVSNLNSNVMLETGIRLSTKRPTIIVTDKVSRPPFDINTFGYLDYPHNLEYNAVDNFISKLTDKIVSVAEAYSKGTYKSFVENYTFETVTPETVSKTADEAILERLDRLTYAVANLQRDSTVRRPVSLAKPSEREVVKTRKVQSVEFSTAEDSIVPMRKELYPLPNSYVDITALGDNKFRLDIYSGLIGDDLKTIVNVVLSTVQKYEVAFLNSAG